MPGRSNGQKNAQEARLAIYNISFGAIVSGVGSVLTEQHGESVTKAFLKGIKWGALGGGFVYLGKKTSYQINSKKQMLYGWPSKFVHDFGISIVENAAKNQEIFGSFRTNVGFIKIDISTQKHFSIHPKVMPFALGSFIYGSIKSKLDLNKTILIGTPVFKANKVFLQGDLGLAGYNTIYMPDTLSYFFYSVIAHEHVHILQESQYFSILTWLRPLHNKLNESKKFTIYKKLEKYFYLDIPIYRIPQIFMNYSPNCFYRNYFELEAQHFASNSYIRKCY